MALKTGAVSELPIPETGAVQELPRPVAPPADEQQAEAVRTHSGAFKRGFRSGFVQTGAMLDNLVGQTGLVLGLEDFAHSRFQEADQYTKFADAIAPEARDYRSVKSFSDLVDFVSSNIGSGIATSIPAIAGAAITRGRPMVGLFGGATALEAGEQVGQLRQNPNVMKTAAPSDVLANALGKGAVGGALEVAGGAPGRVIRRAGRQGLRRATEGLGRDILGEAATEAAQTAVGTEFEKRLDPTVEHSREDLIQSALAGAAGGAGISVAARAPAALIAASNKPDDLSKRVALPVHELDRGPIRDDEEVASRIATGANEEEILKALEGEDDRTAGILREKAKEPDYAEFQNYESDPKVREAFVERLQKDYGRTRLQPDIENFIEAGESALKRVRVEDPKVKYSEDFTGSDLDVHRTFMSILGSREASRRRIEGVDPTKLRQLSHTWRKMLQNPMAFRDSAVVAHIRRIMPREQFNDLLDETLNVVYGAQAGRRAAKDAILDAITPYEENVGARAERLEGMVSRYIRPELAGQLSRADLRRTFVSDLQHYLETAPEKTREDQPGQLVEDPDLIERMVYLFGEKAEPFLNEFEALVNSPRQSLFERQDIDVEKFSDDPRVNKTYKSEFEATDTLDQLRKDYNPRDVRFSIVRATEDPADRSVIIQAERPSAFTLTEDEFEDIREPRNLQRKDPETGKVIQNPAVFKVRMKGQHEINVNAVRLTHLMIDKDNEQTREGGTLKYVADMFSRGVSAMLSMPNFRDVNLGRDSRGNFKFPDDLLVGVVSGQKITWGDVRKAEFPISERAQELREGVKATKRGTPERESALRALDAYYKNARSSNAYIQPMVDEAINSFVNGASEEEALEPLRFAYEEAGSRDMSRRIADGIAYAEEQMGELLQRRATKQEQEHLGTTLRPQDVEGPRTVDEETGESLRQDVGKTGSTGVATPEQIRTHRAHDVSAAERRAPEVKARKAAAKSERRTEKLIKDMVKELNSKAKAAAAIKKSSMDARQKGYRVDEATQKEIKEYVKRVLGDKFTKVNFEVLDRAGSFADLNGWESLIIALDAVDPRGVGYHEAMHAFMKRLSESNRKAARVLKAAASATPIVSKMKEILKDNPAALKQLADPEERVAWMYQLWASGRMELPIGPETQSLFKRIRAFFRKVVAIWTENPDFETALGAADLLNAFHNGEFAERSAMAQVLERVRPESTRERLDDMWPALTGFMDKFVWTAYGSVRNFKIDPMTEVMDKFHTAQSEQGKDPGFMQSKHTHYNRYLNRLVDIIGDMDKNEIKTLLDEMRTKNRTSRQAQALQNLLDEAFDYMTVKEAGDYDTVRTVVREDGKVKRTAEGHPIYKALGKVENYFPRVFDPDYMKNHRDEFIALLKKYNIKHPEAVFNNIIEDVNMVPVADGDETLNLTFFAPFAQERTLGAVPDEELAPFLSDNLVGTLSQYFARAVRRREYARRFGNSGEVIEAARKQAAEQGATSQQLKSFDQSVKALEGTLGADINPELRNVFSAVTTYQNLRLLPVALFASAVDPLGIWVRGGSFTQATKAFFRGIKELVSTTRDDKYSIARAIGSINDMNDIQVVSDMYASNFMPTKMKKLNDTFFKWIGLEAWNRSMRISASAAGVEFLLKHTDQETRTEHSDRYLKELNLTLADVQRDEQGRLVLTDKVKAALNLWVDQAILRPNAAVRPVYMSDPHWILVSHLKQYTYLFQKTIIARAVNEMREGNMGALGALTAYVPLIIMSDMTRGILTPGSGDDHEDWGFMDWLWRGIQRAGLFGPGQMAIDAAADSRYGGLGLEGLLGPTAEQFLDFTRSALGGGGDVTKEAIRAVPGARQLFM